MQKNKVFLIFTAVIILVGAASLNAQSMEIVDNLLASGEAGFGESVYMIAVGSGIADENATINDAVNIITENKWNKSHKEASDPVTLGEMSYIIMQAFGMKGGIMYTLFPSPRYAVRELVFLEVLDSGAHPNKTVTGEDVINILSKAIELKEAE